MPAASTIALYMRVADGSTHHVNVTWRDLRPPLGPEGITRSIWEAWRADPARLQVAFEADGPLESADVWRRHLRAVAAVLRQEHEEAARRDRRQGPATISRQVAIAAVRLTSIEGRHGLAAQVARVLGVPGSHLARWKRSAWWQELQTHEAELLKSGRHEQGAVVAPFNANRADERRLWRELVAQCQEQSHAIAAHHLPEWLAPEAAGQLPIPGVQ